MDGLDILKKDWNKQEEDRKPLSQHELQSMLQKRSTSIVKTLFYISVAELVFWIIINALPLFLSKEYRQNLDAIFGNSAIFNGLTVFSYAIIIVFIYLLYTSYKSISVTDSAKNLMGTILRTRKIIKYYVLYNLILAGISLIIGFYFAFQNNPKITGKITHFSNNQMIVASILIIVFAVIFILMIWLFYKIIYGLLLKRLHRNYNELKRLEV